METAALQFRVIQHGSADYQNAVILRNLLLRIPLGLKLHEQELANEVDRHHLAGFFQGRLIAYLYWEELTPENVQVRQVAVAEDHQKRGIGRALMDFAEAEARRHHIATVTLHAREPVIGFYQKLGYVPEGDLFVELGLPHRLMKKSLLFG